MAEASGKFGRVVVGSTTFGFANDWTLNETADVDTHGIFGGGGKKVSVGGQKVITGTVSGKQDFASPIAAAIEAGEAITLELFETTTASPIGSDYKWTIPAVCDTLVPTTSGDTGPAVGYTFSFVSNGAYTRPS